MAYMRDSSSRRLDGFAVADRVRTGRLRHLPAPAGLGALYLADDECGPVQYIDSGVGWHRTHPRGELVALEMGTASYTTSTSQTAIYDAILELDTDDEVSLVEIQVQASVQVGNSSTDSAWTTGSRFALLRLTENGATLRDLAVIAEGLTSNLGRNSIMTARRRLSPNTHYTYSLSISSQNVAPVVNVRTQNLVMKVVEL